MKKTLTADLLLLFVAFIWGSTFVLVQNAIAILPPFTFNAVRFLLAGIPLLVLLLLARKKGNWVVEKEVMLPGVILGVWLFFGYGLQTLGLVYTTSSKAGFITGLSVVLVPIICFLWLKEKIHQQAIVGVSIATFGLYLLTMFDYLAFNIGDFFVLLCAVSFAVHIVLTGKFTKIYTAIALTTVQIFTVAILSTFSALLFEKPWLLDSQDLFHFEVVFALLICAFLATTVAFFIQTHVQKFTSPTRVALIFAMEPVFAAITGYLWANERLSTFAVVGCIFIFVGMILAELPIRKKKVEISV
ncbi:DMT family transporter [Bacillus sp. FJAT-45066]|uniref:DMT family transporter n=1 Tax=Bacillus sp. FJAT-45066 TaxID=2011010 RepID=UPI000BB70D2E|nr:DMT family transporter [Bacillus sp. FJAT-45066]